MRRAALAITLLYPTLARAGECDTMDPAWLVCEDFEDGGLGWDAWYAQSPFVQCVGCGDPDRMRLLNDSAQAFEDDWSLYMPAEDADNRGASLAWRSCDGAKVGNCPLIGYDQIYWRAWLRLAPDHQYVHHFMSIGGTRPDGFWEGDGNAGCRPNGERACGTTVDFNTSHELFFYTYYPEMGCDPPEAGGGYCEAMQPGLCDDCAAKEMPCDNGWECCWGNHFGPAPRPVLPVGQWVCVEMMMRVNSVNPVQSDGEMAYWVDGVLGHRETGMHWRDIPELQLNKVWVQHYIDADDANQPNRIWWDNIVISTERIGCGTTPPPDGGPEPDGATPDGASTGDTTPAGDPAFGDAVATGDATAAPPPSAVVGSCQCQSAAAWWPVALLALRRRRRSLARET